MNDADYRIRIVRIAAGLILLDTEDTNDVAQSMSIQLNDEVLAGRDLTQVVFDLLVAILTYSRSHLDDCIDYEMKMTQVTLGLLGKVSA